jgi:hypothetical protein
MNNLLDAIKEMRFARKLPHTLLEVKQSFDVQRVEDVTQSTRDALENSGMLSRVFPGQSVAVGVGSRGITNIALIAQATVARLKEHGAHPFVVAAMGSHGGATPEGQREMLRTLGVTEEFVGCEFHVTMEVKEIGRVPDGPPLYQDLHSAKADHVILLSRIKPHTDFRGKLESGPAKMAVIGLGKQHGAQTMHSYGGNGFRKFLAPAARVYEKKTNLLGAVCILENAYDETGKIVGLTKEHIGTEVEERLQAEAKSMLASLPFDKIDVLVVQRHGKNISGTGMDTNVLRRLMVPHEPEALSQPTIIATLDLTDETHGNASGLGLANVTTARVLNKIDWQKFYMNGITSGTFGAMRSSLPIVMPDDRRALEVAVQCCGVPNDDDVKFVLIRDTLALDRLWISPALRDDALIHPRLSVVRETPLAFDDCGMMVSPWAF